MSMYQFTVVINGTGDDATEAWNDAVAGLSMEPGPTPEPSEYTIEED